MPVSAAPSGSIADHGQGGLSVTRLQLQEQKAGFLDVSLGPALRCSIHRNGCRVFGTGNESKGLRKPAECERVGELFICCHCRNPKSRRPCLLPCPALRRRDGYTRGEDFCVALQTLFPQGGGQPSAVCGFDIKFGAPGFGLSLRSYWLFRQYGYPLRFTIDGCDGLIAQPY